MIDVVHLSKHFGDLVVLDDISDTVYEGEKVCIIGPSGSGKSFHMKFPRSKRRQTEAKPSVIKHWFTANMF